MERVEGLMRGLKLSEAESRGVKIGQGSLSRGKEGLEQAVGKLLANKPAIPKTMEEALGPLWCPMKGIECKEIGENVFLFTFLQAGGRKKAVDNGPWMFEKSLIVMEDFDTTKNVEDYSFASIPIWVRVYKMPLGLMSRKNGVIIGDRVGEFMEMEGVENGMAVGKCLRVKVRLDISVPLMRGTTMEFDETGRTIWCPFEYEYLPDFCFTCGIVGHKDSDCSIRLGKGEEPQYGNWLKWMPPRRGRIDSKRNWNDYGDRRSFGWGSRGSGSGSDGPSWRKTETKSLENGKSTGEENEVTRPLKIKGKDVATKETEGKTAPASQKQLCLDEKSNALTVLEERKDTDRKIAGEDGSAMLLDVVAEDGRKEGKGREEEGSGGKKVENKVEEVGKGEKGRGRPFKRMARAGKNEKNEQGENTEKKTKKKKGCR